MRVFIGVVNFGKIEKAEIDISNFAVFVGDNNSGKTYLMQLIYGVLQYLAIPEEYTPAYINSILDDIICNDRYIVSKETIENLCDEINAYLEKSKKQLVEKIFQRNVPIDRLYIKCEIEEGKMLITHQNDVTAYNGKDKPQEYEKWEVFYDGNPRGFHGVYPRKITAGRLLNMVLFAMGIGKSYRLFIPASRTGIQLLYKEFYAQKVDKLFHGEDDKDNQLGLTLPVYDFLRFLQTYKNGSEGSGRDIVQFIEDNLISGHLQAGENNNIEYISQENKVRVPLYMASSMINEVSPIVMAYTMGVHYDNLIIDEVETSLHPKKQREMARLLCRINNIGTKLIVSTHSDTMAAYLNILVMMAKNRALYQNKLSDLKLEEKDILNVPEVHFYQFKENGKKSSIKELEFSKTSTIGVNFELFNDSLDILYNTSKILAEG